MGRSVRAVCRSIEKNPAPEVRGQKEGIMRRFLILETKYNSGKIISSVIRGVVESTIYPSYDSETLKKLYGIESAEIVEIPAENGKCHVKLM